MHPFILLHPPVQPFNEANIYSSIYKFFYSTVIQSFFYPTFIQPSISIIILSSSNHPSIDNPTTHTDTHKYTHTHIRIYTLLSNEGESATKTHLFFLYSPLGKYSRRLTVMMPPGVNLSLGPEEAAHRY